MTHLARIAARLFDTPLLVRPETAGVIVNVLSDRVGVEPMIATPFDEDAPGMSRFRGAPVRQNGDGASLYRLDNGVAIVPVLGELVNRGAWIGASSGLTSYEGIEAALRAAVDDTRVQAILLDMNSPGGEATGALETGELVRSIDAKKPVVAFVNGLAASAAYAIASGARKIVALPSAVLGSIGVVVMHRDVSAAMDKAGVKTTIIHAGAYKADGSPFRALPDDARSRIQGHVDALYDLFTDMVARHRGMDVSAVRDTEAGVYFGASAVEAGLADSIGMLDDAISQLRRSNVSIGSTSLTGGSMTETTAGAFTQAQLDQAVAAARAEGFTAGATEAQARIAGILGHEEAAPRATLARHLAFNTNVPQADAIAMLAASAREGGAGASVMDRVPRPDVKPDNAAPVAASDYDAGVAAFAKVIPDHMRAKH